ncbi:MAG: Holliday junction DNA helicase RuvA [Planctomycetaceae bacterium]|nr:Holliday junction DNA helicase RuvA [Planctomycetaceae bacterium]
MITNISGTLTHLEEDRAILQVGPLAYEILIPEFVRRQLQANLGEEISLHTIFYLDGNPNQGRLSPRLVGFQGHVEREFFELFCSVDGVGAKKALRAMVRPVKDVATLIEDQDVKGLSALPGIGPATSERIIAKLRRKMPKFALMVTAESVPLDDGKRDLIEQTYLVLCNLGHSESDARQLIDTVLESGTEYKDVETLLQAVYQSSQE